MIRGSKAAIILMSAGVLSACSNDQIEEYPDADEVPVTESEMGGPGTAQSGTDTLLSPVVQPPEGATPP